MPVRTLLLKWLGQEPTAGPKRPRIRGKTDLVLKSLLAIHESITDADAMQGYEGLPEQVEEIYWEIWSLLERNPGLKQPEEVLEEWMEDYATKHLP